MKKNWKQLKMEVLNHNQRKSALWRIVGLFGILLILLLLVNFSMNTAFSGKDDGQIEVLRAEMAKVGMDKKGELQDLRNRRNSLKKKLDSVNQDNSKEQSLHMLEVKEERAKVELEKAKKDFTKITEAVQNYNSAIKTCNGDTEE